MAKTSVTPAIRLRGVRHNNLKNFDLDLPLNQLIVVTGLSGSGKSSLAFDTLFAEGQRRYIETFSPYARQFFDRMDKPQVDSIEGIPPAIAIEQRNAVKTTRSTVGTMTEICDYMRLLWPQIAQLHCKQCGRPVRKEPPQTVWESVRANDDPGELLITFIVPVSEKLSLDESLALISKQGYQRLLLDGETVRLEEALPQLRDQKPASLTIIQDRIRPTKANRARFIEACEQAYHFGKGKLSLVPLNSSDTGHAPRFFSNRLHCANCDIEYREPSPALFSFNHPVGACPACRGFGRIITIDYDLALPDRSKTLAEGVVKPWQSGQSAECHDDLMTFCRKRNAPTNVPFRDLPQKWQDWVMNGDPDYGKDSAHRWPRAWYGIKGYFRWLESKSYKMHVRVLLSRYRAYQPCPTCEGKRFQPDALLYRVGVGDKWIGAERKSLVSVPPGNSRNAEISYSRIRTMDGLALNESLGLIQTADRVEGATLPEAGFGESLTLADFYCLPVRDASAFIDRLTAGKQPKPTDPLGLALGEVRNRLGYLNDVGLGYLTLDRPTRSLSGGETERVNLTTCLGTRLVNTLFVLDEPSVGLHPRDTSRLVRILKELRDAGNTVVVVEHEASVMQAADQIIDLGPGHGAAGGNVVFQGPYGKILKFEDSLTGQYLADRRRIEIPERRPVTLVADGISYGVKNRRAQRPNNGSEGKGASLTPKLILRHATLHNLQDLTVEFPLGRFVCLTGVSGSGKTTLAREVLLPALQSKLQAARSETKASERIDSTTDNDSDDGDSALEITNSASIEGWEQLGRVVLVDQSILAKTPRSNPAVYIGAFDAIREVFAQSELARQRGLSSSAFSFNSGQGQCERCRGAGFEKIEMQFLSDVFVRCSECNGRRYRPHILKIQISPNPDARKHAAWSIADLLDATVDEAVEFLSAFENSRPARGAAQSLKLLQEVGLGYLRLGQPINTMSGGESQRLKLVRHLSEFAEANERDAKPTLFLFDEPTTGLHFDDVRVLLQVFQRLVDAGHSVLIIEHNLDVIKSADWAIDLGPDAGDRGGRLVFQGTPEDMAACSESRTGEALADLFGQNNRRKLAPASP
jgi:excinuclease ABC subunit A